VQYGLHVALNGEYADVRTLAALVERHCRGLGRAQAICAITDVAEWRA
jgi:hypothetical protein